MSLRAYQQRAVAEARACVLSGRRKVVICAPCGAGKSTIGSAIAAGALNKGKRVVWLAHREELVAQARETLDRLGATEAAVHTIQGLIARGEAPDGDLVLIDEVHHVVSDCWGAVLQAYASRIIIGLTATPARGDGRGLAPDFQEIVVAAQISELVALGHLVPCEVVRPPRALKAGQIAQTPAAAYQRHAPGSRCIVFAPHVKAANEFAKAFPSAAVVHAKSKDRVGIMNAYRSGKVPVLVNVGIATEGVDVPETETVIVARGCGAVGLWIQMCGRAMRPSTGKRRALVVDLRGVSYDLGRPDADRAYSLDGEGISGASSVVAEERLCRMCQAVLGDEETCPACGCFCGLEVPKAIGVELEAWNEQYAGDGNEERVARLAKWLRVMMAQGKAGKSLFAAQYRFAATYKAKPDRATWDEAMRMARRSA